MHYWSRNSPHTTDSITVSAAPSPNPAASRPIFILFTHLYRSLPYPLSLSGYCSKILCAFVTSTRFPWFHNPLKAAPKQKLGSKRSDADLFQNSKRFDTRVYNVSELSYQLLSTDELNTGLLTENNSHFTNDRTLNPLLPWILDNSFFSPLAWVLCNAGSGPASNSPVFFNNVHSATAMDHVMKY